MCILIYADNGKTIPTKHLENSCESNPDGFGWAIITTTPDGAKWTIISHKTMKAEEAIKTFEEARELHPTYPAMFHARIATHGSVNIDNCHPFNVEDGTLLAHNGILPIRERDGRSDTRQFAEEWLPTLGVAELLDDPDGFAQLEEFTRGSKLVVLSVSPTLQKFAYIVNEDDGHWLDGVWYSNTSYKWSSFKTYGYVPGREYSGWGHSWNDDDFDTVRVGGRSGRNYTWGVCTICRDDTLWCPEDPRCGTCGFCMVHGAMNGCECPRDATSLLTHEDNLDDFGGVSAHQDTYDDLVDSFFEGDWYIDSANLLHVYDNRHEHYRVAHTDEVCVFEDLFGSIQRIADNAELRASKDDPIAPAALFRHMRLIDDGKINRNIQGQLALPVSTSKD